MGIKLTPVERTILRNQLKILQLLDKRTDLSEDIEILESGYTVFYSKVVNVSDDVPEDECKFVLDVLSMYRALDTYFRDNPNDENGKEYWARFQGFDGNNEGNMMAFAQFLINDQGKFAEQKKRPTESDGFNSHSPSVETYTHMLDAWNLAQRRYRLTQEEVTHIIAAARTDAASDSE